MCNISKDWTESSTEAEIVKPEEIPSVITINLTFRLRDLDSGEEVVYTWYFPVRPIPRMERFQSWPPSGLQCWDIGSMKQ